jgi:hypothetical protein
LNNHCLWRVGGAVHSSKTPQSVASGAQADFGATGRDLEKSKLGRTLGGLSCPGLLGIGSSRGGVLMKEAVFARRRNGKNRVEAVQARVQQARAVLGRCFFTKLRVPLVLGRHSSRRNRNHESNDARNMHGTVPDSGVAPRRLGFRRDRAESTTMNGTKTEPERNWNRTRKVWVYPEESAIWRLADRACVLCLGARKPIRTHCTRGCAAMTCKLALSRTLA